MLSPLMKLVQQPICSLLLTETQGFSLTSFGTHVWLDAERNHVQMVRQFLQHKIKLHTFNIYMQLSSPVCQMPSSMRLWLYLQQSCLFELEQQVNEGLYGWTPKSHYFTDRWTQQCYTFLLWKGLNLLLVILKAFPWSQSMDVKCVGRTTLFKNESAGSRLSDVSGYRAAVIHHARSLGSLLWGLLFNLGIRVSGGWINQAEAVRSWMRLGINAWCLTWAMCVCVCSIVLD